MNKSKWTASDYVPGNRYPIDWECVLCDRMALLIWDLARGSCFCDHCGAPYTFFPDGYEKPASNFPVSSIKPDWLDAVRYVYKDGDPEDMFNTFSSLNVVEIEQAKVNLDEGAIDPV